MRSEGYGSRSVCLTGYEAAYEQYQQLQCYKGDFTETTAFERHGVKTSGKANMHKLCGGLSLLR